MMNFSEGRCLLELTHRNSGDRGDVWIPITKKVYWPPTGGTAGGNGGQTASAASSSSSSAPAAAPAATNIKSEGSTSAHSGKKGGKWREKERKAFLTTRC